MKVDWEMASLCACNQQIKISTSLITMEGDSFEKRSDCPNCKGRGWVHHSKQEIPALVLSASRDPERFKLYGMAARGMVKITTLSEHLVSFMDRFTLKDSVMTYSESTKRLATTEFARYPIVKRTFSVGSGPSNTTPETVTIGVLHCNVTDANGVIVTDDNGPVVLSEDSDFTVSNDGKIDWTLGDGASTAANPAGVDFTGTTAITRKDGGSWIADGFKSGARITIANATNTLNNGTKYISSLTATTINVRTVDGVAASAGDTAVSFSGGKAPAVGCRYSLQYYCHPVYICKSNPHTYRDTFVLEKSANPTFTSLPVLSECWLEWLGDDAGSGGA